MRLVLRVVEREGEAAVGRHNPDLDLVNAAILYVQRYSIKVHQVREELIFGHLICHFPKFGRDVFLLLDQHRKLEMQVGLLERSLRTVDPSDPSSRQEFCDTVHTFVDSKAEHIRAEEQLFYPSAERWLTADEWAEVDHFMPNEQDPLGSETADSAFAGLREAIRRASLLPAL